MSPTPHVLILGAGFAGFHTARALRRATDSGRIRLTIVEPEPYLTYKPLLSEVAGGHTQPRDTTVGLARPLSFADLVAGSVESVDCESKTAVLRALDGTERAIGYDHVVFALGAVTKTLPITGLAEQAVGFATLEEAVFLRNQVLDRIRFAATTTDSALRDRALRFVFVGGGYTGVEAIAELHELALRAHATYPALASSPPQWFLIEASHRIAAELPKPLSEWTLALLRRRGIVVKLNTEMTSCADGRVTTDSGDTFASDTIVWAAGVVPNPALDHTNAPRGSKGHVQANDRLQVIDNDGTPVPGAWAIGDNAEVPDRDAQNQPAFYPANAQHAQRQGRLAAENILRMLDGDEPLPYRHRSLGTLASFGGQQGAAEVRGVPLHGVPAWLLAKAYHAVAIPDASRRVRIAANWAANALAARDLTSTSAARRPRIPFTMAFVSRSGEKTSR
jgi:NADH dehydrogenase